MPPPPQLTADLLLAHSASLRELARRLLRDGHAAEDALQDTFARAIERPPASLERVGGWLRCVLESVAHKRVRSDSRRVRREREGARSEIVHVEHAAERSEVLRCVLDAVLALDEPYRDVVLDRYFEDLSPREIARRRGLPLNTVTSRLGRARTRLRERLEHRLGQADGRWSRSLSSLFGLALPSTRSASAIGGLIPGVLAVSLNTKWIAAAALVALAGISWFVRGGGPLAPDSGAPVKSEGVAPAKVAGTARSAESSELVHEQSQRQLAAPTEEHAALVTRKTPPNHFPLSVQVVDGEDRPLSGAVVHVAPRGRRWNRAGVTDAMGELRFELRGFGGTLPIDLHVASPFGHGGSMVELDLSAGVPTAAAFGSEAASRMRLQMMVTVKDSGGSDLPVMSYLVNYPRSEVHEPDLAPYSDGGFAFVDPPLPPEAGDEYLEPNTPILSGLPRVDLSGDFDLAVGTILRGGTIIAESEIAFGEEVEEPSGPRAGISRATGTVYNSSGSELAGLHVEARDLSGKVLLRTITAEDGSFEIELDAEVEGPITLKAGGGERGIAATNWRPRVEPELRWDPLLDRGNELLGRLLDRDDKIFADWIVEVEIADSQEPYWDSTRSAPDGRFAIPNLPERPMRILLRPGDAPTRLPFVLRDGIWAGQDEYDFELDRAALIPAEVHVQISDGDGLALEHCKLRLFQDASGRGCEMSTGSEPGVYSRDKLPAGNYRLEIGNRTEGWTEAASFRLAPGEQLDLGSIQLDPPAALELSFPHFETPPKLEHLTLWRIDPSHEALVIDAQAAPDGVFGLPAGRYELRVAHRGVLFEQTIVLDPGEHHMLSFDELEPVATEPAVGDPAGESH